MAWEFLGLQCRHWVGWRKAADGIQTCRICGLVEGTNQHWPLLPRDGRKIIGSKAIPTSKETFANKKCAAIVKDTIEFHGATVNVDVHNAYRSRLFRCKNWSIAAERILRLNEDGLECWLDTHLFRLRMGKRERGTEPPFSAFVAELPRKALKRFPVMLEHDRRGRFVGLTIFKPRPAARPLRVPAVNGDSRPSHEEVNSSAHFRHDALCCDSSERLRTNCSAVSHGTPADVGTSSGFAADNGEQITH
ncbi:MAG: hypothetical protein HY735_18685 [Verrucomicrobia bacterium]|nr:hypothetical protein [Verrucomicrobiota bacterium]